VQPFLLKSVAAKPHNSIVSWPTWPPLWDNWYHPQHSKYTFVKKLKTLRDIQALSKINEKNIKIQACELDEPVCQNNGDETEGTFCFFYDIVFIKLGLRLPLDLFKKEILSIMNIVTAQLHLNSSTIVRAFSILYTHFSLIPMSNMFFFSFLSLNYHLINCVHL